MDMPTYEASRDASIAKLAAAGWKLPEDDNQDEIEAQMANATPGARVYGADILDDMATNPDAYAKWLVRL